jgi:putative ABC transport system permease protein
LKPEMSVEQARADMTSIAGALETEYPDTNTKMGVSIGPLQEWIVGDSRPALLVLLAAVGLVLLIACANVANLLLARAESRRKEIAIRSALGAGRGRIIQQLFIESLVLALVGGALGVLVAVWAKVLLLAIAPRGIPRLDEVKLDGAALGFTLLITLLAAFVAGLFPAVQVSRHEVTDTLREGQKGSGGSRRARLRSLLVVSEVALSFTLVIAAGLLIRSFARLTQVEPGVDINNVLTLKLELPGSRYPEGRQAISFFEEVERRLNEMPGVESAGACTRLPLEGYNWTGDATVDGRDADDYLREVRHKQITQNYLRAMKIPLLEGRGYEEHDTATSVPVVMVNDVFARWAYPNQDAVGRRVKFLKPTIEGPWYTIIGVVRGEKQDGLDKEVKPEVYEIHRQNANSQMFIVARTTGDPMKLVGAVREQIREIDRDLPPFDIRPMREVLSLSLATRRFTMLLLGIFAALALALATIGIYGVIAYSVSQRTHEIGLRRALGAQSADVLRLILWQALKLAIAGIALGLGVSLALARLMTGLVFGVSVTDPGTFAVVAVLLSGVAFFAACIPARRAIKVDPMVALRYE